MHNKLFILLRTLAYYFVQKALATFIVHHSCFIIPYYVYSHRYPFRRRGFNRPF